MLHAALQECLQHSKFFQNFDDQPVQGLLGLGAFKQLPHGATIYAQGDTSNNTFCLIVSDQAAITTPDGALIKTVEQGEVLGEIALFSPQRKRTATVVSVGPTVLVEWEIQQVQQHLPELRPRLFRLIWKNMQGCYQT